MGEALARTGAAGLAVSGSIQLNGIAEVFRLAEALSSAAGFVPAAYVGKPNNIAAAILTGIEIGMGPLEALREIHVVQGRPTLSSGSMLARAIRAGIKVEWLESSDKAARLRLTRGGVSYEQSWTMDDAKRAGLLAKSGPWQTFPGAMLRARAISAAVRAFCPDVIGGGGLYTPEEAADIEERPAGSSYSADVRDLGAAVHEPDREDDGGPDPLEHVMHAFASCKTVRAVETAIRAHALAISREKDSPRKRERWGQLCTMVASFKHENGNMVFPRDKFRAAIVTAVAESKKSAAPKPADVIDGERDPLDELLSVETSDGLRAWFGDHRDWLAGLPQGGEAEVTAWDAIHKRARHVGDAHLADELSESLG